MEKVKHIKLLDKHKMQPNFLQLIYWKGKSLVVLQDSSLGKPFFELVCIPNSKEVSTYQIIVGLN